MEERKPGEASGLGTRTGPSWLPLSVFGLIVLVGIWLRIRVYGFSLVGDELSTLWIVKGNGLSEVIDVVSGDGEISPPLFFVLAWIASKAGGAPELIRLPSLIAGLLSLPLFYLLGTRLSSEPKVRLITVAVAALSPILIYFSGNGRAYAVMIFLLLLSTVAMLNAVDTGRKRSWLLYALASAGVMYSHYAGVFVLLAQLGWLLWVFPEKRLHAILSNCFAALLFLPWLSAFFADSDSPTTPILEALQGSGFEAKRVAVEQLLFWRIDADTWSLSGRWDAALIVVGLLLALVFILVRIWRTTGFRSCFDKLDRNLVLVLLLVVATPVGALVMGIFSTDIFGGRNLAASWTGIPLLVGMIMAAAGPTAGLVGTTLVLAGLGVGSVQLADQTRTEFRYSDAAEFVESETEPGSALIDLSHITPAPLTPLDAYLDFGGAEYRVNQPEIDPPFLPGTPVPDPAIQMKAAFKGTDRVFVVTLIGHEDIARTRELTLIGKQYPIPKGWQVTEQRTFDGIYPITVTVIDREPAQTTKRAASE